VDHSQQPAPVPEAGSLTELLRAKIASDKQDSQIPKEHCTERLGAVLDHRGNTHGDFEHGAVISQRLKCALAAGASWDAMDVVQREALEAVVGKLARIVAGDPYFLDHYRDVIGYTQLAMNYTAKQSQATDVAITRFKPNEPLTGSEIGGAL